jgi:two-component sensor histidine kinase
MCLTELYARFSADVLQRLRFAEGRRARAEFVRNQKITQERIEKQRLLTAELSHRVRNVITVVQAISRDSRNRAHDLGEYAKTFDERLQALARSHGDLALDDRSGAQLRDIICEQMASFGRDRLLVSGPTIQVDAETASALALIFHELAVNATKHGALRNDRGRVTVKWDEPACGVVQIEWIESGGPLVLPPQHAGSGAALFGRIAESATIEPQIRYLPSGVTCSLRVKLGAD